MGIGSELSVTCLGQGGILPAFNMSFIREFEKILESYTLPGHLITTSRKQYLESQHACTLSEYRCFVLI